MRSQKQKSLRQLTAEDITRAAEQNYVDYWRCVGLSPNAVFSEEGGITQCVTGLPQELFNVVMKCRLSEVDIDSRIDSVIGMFKSRRLDMIWHVGELTEPRDLGRYLEARGHPHDYDLIAMAIDLDECEDRSDGGWKSITKPVVSETDCREWIACLTRSWESPREVAIWMAENACFNTSVERSLGLSLPRKMFLGYREEVPVSASMLFWSEGIAGLQTVGTVHEGRGRGVAGATVKAAVDEARRAGFGFVVVLSTVEGVGMYKKVGFIPFGKLPEHSMHFSGSFGQSESPGRP